MDVYSEENINFEFTNFTPNESPMIKKIISKTIYPELTNLFNEEIKEDNLIATLNSQLQKG